MIKAARLILLVLSLPALHYRGTAQILPPPEMKVYEKDSYTISYPADWQADGTKLYGADLFLFSPLSSASDEFRENVNLMIQDLTKMPVDLRQYTAISEQQIKKNIVNGTLIESRTVTTAGHEEQHLIYTSDQGRFHLEYEQVYRVVGMRAYVLTFTAEADEFQRYRARAEEIMRSFHLR